MTDRLRQARAEAERQPGVGNGYTEKQAAAFVEGVVWADANSKPHTITRTEFEAAWEHAYDDEGMGPPAIEKTLRILGIEVVDEEGATSIPTDCAACGKPAEGFAMINNRRFCHPDNGPSCYMGGRR